MSADEYDRLGNIKTEVCSTRRVKLAGKYTTDLCDGDDERESMITRRRKFGEEVKVKTGVPLWLRWPSGSVMATIGQNRSQARQEEEGMEVPVMASEGRRGSGGGCELGVLLITIGGGGLDANPSETRALDKHLVQLLECVGFHLRVHAANQRAACVASSADVALEPFVYLVRHVAHSAGIEDHRELPIAHKVLEEIAPFAGAEAHIVVQGAERDDL